MTAFELRERLATARDRAGVSAILSIVCLFGSGPACTGRFSDGGGGGSSTGMGSPGTAGRASSGTAGTNGPGTAGAVGTGGTGATAEPPPTCTAGAINPGRTPLRRLNGAEYDNTVRDLLGVAKSYSATFPADNQGVGFSNNADALSTDILLAQGYQGAAEEMAANAAANLAALAPPCTTTTTTGTAACAKSFVQTFGKKAFRRPLTAEEVTRYQAIFTTGSTGYTYNDGISLVIEAMLQSPHFLYRVETGTPTSNPNIFALNQYELATRMSYFLWQSMPDDLLLAAADANQLSTNEQLSAQVTRMLQSDHAKQMVSQFHREWLMLTGVLAADKPTSVNPDWTPQLAADLFTEADTFVSQTFWNDGKISTLLTAPYSYMNANVAKHYGVPAPTGTGFMKVDLDPTQRMGILTQAAFLAGQAKPDQSSPVLRGKYVREQVLCEEVQPPPPGLMIVVPPVTAGTTTRERFNSHDGQPACAGCHTLMDPLGYAFEGFDATGIPRTMDGGKPVDASGQVNGAEDPALNGAFTGPVDLAKKLAASPEVAACVAKQWFRWGTGRAETEQDACSLTSINQQFQAANYDMRTLPLAILSTDAFRYRVGGAP